MSQKIPRDIAQKKSPARLKTAPAVPEKGTYTAGRERVRDYNAFSVRGGRR